MNRPAMGSEYDVPYVHELIDEIERLREINKGLTRDYNLMASEELKQRERANEVVEDAMERADDSWAGGPFPVGPGISEGFRKAVQDRRTLAAEVKRLVEQLEAANARKQELWDRLLVMEGKYLDASNQLEDLREAAQAVADVRSYVSIDGRVVLADEALDERVAALRAVLNPAIVQSAAGENPDAAGGNSGRSAPSPASEPSDA